MWTGLPLGRARAGIAVAEGSITSIDVDGTTYWYAASLDPGRVRSVLLPAFDEYIVGYADRKYVVPDAVKHLVMQVENGIFRPAVLRGAVAAGSWRAAEAAGASADLEIRPYAGTRLAGTAAARRGYERFVAAEEPVANLAIR
jgi:hypothetical protein